MKTAGHMIEVIQALHDGKIIVSEDEQWYHRMEDSKIFTSRNGKDNTWTVTEYVGHFTKGLLAGQYRIKPEEKQELVMPELGSKWEFLNMEIIINNLPVLKVFGPDNKDLTYDFRSQHDIFRFHDHWKPINEK